MQPSEGSQSDRIGAKSLVLSVATIFAAVVAGLGLFALSSCKAAPPPAVATVSVSTQQLGAQIPKNFLGFSNEVSTEGMGLPTPTAKARGSIQRPAGVPADAQLGYVLGQPGAPNTVFFTMMRNLGPGLLRQGGNSQDLTCWDPSAAPHPSWCKGAITPGLLKLYGTAVSAAGWKMTLGLNLKQNSPRWALSEVTQGVAKEIPASDILGFEIGNEPGGYSSWSHARSKSYSLQDYIQNVLAYIHAFKANPVARKYGYVGPAGPSGKWQNPHDLNIILNGLGKYLRLVSIHNYTTTTCGQRNVTPAELLSPERMQHFDELSRKFVAVAHEHNLPIGLLETNSASCGGMAGVSNGFASAVWGLDYMFNVAKVGYDHINFHFSYRKGGSAYNPVQTFGWKVGNKEHYRNVAQPLYYAMYMFAKNASGEHLLPASITTKSHITSFATTSCSSCAVHVFVINEDGKASGPVDVHLSGTAGTASLLLLKARSLESLAADVHYGGRQFDSEGHIQAPETTSIKPGAKGDYRFTLPNASAAVLTISR